MSGGDRIEVESAGQPASSVLGTDATAQLLRLGGEQTFSRQDVTWLLAALQQLASAHLREEVIEIVTRCARAIVGADGTTFVLREGDQVFYAEEDASSPLWKGRRFSIDECPSGWAVRRGEVVSISDLSADPRVPHELYHDTFVQSATIVPVNRREPIGAIGVYWARPHQTSARELDLLQALADAASTAWMNAHLYAALIRAEEASRAANNAKDEFMAILGHELRNPLAPISTALHLLKLKSPGPQSNELAIIERQTKHLLRLVDDLLDLSRVTRGKVELRRRRLPVDELVAKGIELAMPIIEQRHHEIAVQVDEGLVIEGDEVRLTQVLSNLLTNAAKYTPERGHIRVNARTVKDKVVVTVEDDGVGLAPEILPRLFQPFVQASQSIARSQGGLGLGLALARTLVQAHGGAIEAFSAGPGTGSRFEVRLPRPVSAAPVLRDGPSGSLARPCTPRRILLVDDNRDALDVLGDLLRCQGHLVVSAADPAEALALARQHCFDVAILDIGLPVMDGYELGRRLTDELGPGCPRLIALTGYGQAKDREQSGRAGFSEHLVKPVELGVLTGALERVMQAGTA